MAVCSPGTPRAPLSLLGRAVPELYANLLLSGRLPRGTLCVQRTAAGPFRGGEGALRFSGGGYLDKLSLLPSLSQGSVNV